MTCTLHNETDEASRAFLNIEYSDSGEFGWLAKEAESNKDGDWKPLNIKGQEGKGWINEGYDFGPRALWVFPDGSDLSIIIYDTTDADNVRTLMRAIVGTAAEHNKSSGKVSISHNYFFPVSWPTSQASPNSVSDEARLCRGILTDDFLKNELSFTSSSAKYFYRNENKTYGSNTHRTECSLYDNKPSRLYDERTSKKGLRIEYDANVDRSSYSYYDGIGRVVTEAESNEDGNWRPLTLDGREGKGWIQREPVNSTQRKAVWINPDDSGVVVQLREYDDDDSGWLNSEGEMNHGTEESVKALMHRVLDTAPEHNKTAGTVSEQAGSSD